MHSIANGAMPQLASAAMYQGVADRFFRWPYQAKVMKTFDAASSAMVCSEIGRLVMQAVFRCVGRARRRADR